MTIKGTVLEALNYKACSFKAVHDTAQALIREGKYIECARLLSGNVSDPFTNLELDLIKEWSKENKALGVTGKDLKDG